MTSKDGRPTIKTFSGITFDFLSPRPEMIGIDDIAHALSNICRFGGQAKQFYSVAQHSVLVSTLVDDDDIVLKRMALMHDAAEAYVGDMVKPLKRICPDYEKVEDRIHAVIAEVFKLPYPMPEAVKDADRLALAIEGKHFMGGREDEYGTAPDPCPEVLALPSPWAESLFMERYEVLFNG